MNFWKGKKVLVTGSEGFLGKYLVKDLQKKKAQVFGLDIKIRGEDVRNYDFVKNVILTNKIQIVYHLAAEAIVGRAIENPRIAFSTNICGTWNVLESSRLSHYIEAVIVAASDKAYGEHDNLPYKEHYPLLAQYPYDVSKSCADILARSYFCTYGLPVVITRCGNFYGYGDDNMSRIVPSAVNCLVNNKTLVLNDEGTFVRDFLYIDDAVDGYVKVGELLQEKNLAGEVFNFSCDKPITGIELAQMINKITCGRLKIEKSKILRCEIKKQYLSSEKARKVLNWKPKTTIEEGLRRTINATYKQGTVQPHVFAREEASCVCQNCTAS